MQIRYNNGQAYVLTDTNGNPKIRYASGSPNPEPPSDSSSSESSGSSSSDSGDESLTYYCVNIT